MVVSYCFRPLNGLRSHTLLEDSMALSAGEDSAGSDDHCPQATPANLGPSALLELLQRCESEASEVSVDSYGEPRDREQAAEQQRLLQVWSLDCLQRLRDQKRCVFITC